MSSSRAQGASRAGRPQGGPTPAPGTPGTPGGWREQCLEVTISCLLFATAVLVCAPRVLAKAGKGFPLCHQDAGQPCHHLRGLPSPTLRPQPRWSCRASRSAPSGWSARCPCPWSPWNHCWASASTPSSSWENLEARPGSCWSRTNPEGPQASGRGSSPPTLCPELAGAKVWAQARRPSCTDQAHLQFGSKDSAQGLGTPSGTRPGAGGRGRLRQGRLTVYRAQWVLPGRLAPADRDRR